MSALSVIPDPVDVAAYAGDSLMLTVTVPAGYADGLTWAAQIRAASDAADVAQSFTVTPPAAGGTAAVLTLTGEQTSALVSTTGVRRLTINGRSITKFSGVWDVQVSAGGLDPIRTLARGSFTVESDVTRP